MGAYHRGIHSAKVQADLIACENRLKIPHWVLFAKRS